METGFLGGDSNMSISKNRNVLLLINCFKIVTKVDLSGINSLSSKLPWTKLVSFEHREVFIIPNLCLIPFTLSSKKYGRGFMIHTLEMNHWLPNNQRLLIKYFLYKDLFLEKAQDTEMKSYLQLIFH